MGGFGGPGAMKATVEAVALLATTGSRTRSSTSEMFRKSRTVHTPCKKHKWCKLINLFLLLKIRISQKEIVLSLQKNNEGSKMGQIKKAHYYTKYITANYWPQLAREHSNQQNVSQISNSAYALQKHKWLQINQSPPFLLLLVLAMMY